ncbi:MAG: bile acid:sodium symporter family protein [Ectobacillus sp.]
MLQTINGRLEKMMPLITPASVVLGVLFAVQLVPYTFLVPWIFAFMTFTGSLGSNFKSLKQVVLHPLPPIIVLVILHVLMPVWAWGFGQLAFSGDVHTIAGFVLAAAIPTGITSIIWVSVYKGDIVLALSIVLIDTLLSPIIVPNLMLLFGEKAIDIDTWPMMKGLCIMVVVPSLLGMLLNQLTCGKAKETAGVFLAPFSKLGLGAVVMINSASVAPYLANINFKLILIACSVFMIALSGYVLSWLIGKLLKWERDVIVTSMFTGGMRNISVGAVLAVTYFPAATAVPVILGMLFQQVLASSCGHLLGHYDHPIYRANVKEKIAQR